MDISPCEIDRRELFEALDLNRDGRICLRDVRRVMQMLGQPSIEASGKGWLLLRAIEDTGLSGLDYQQFSALLSDEDAAERRRLQALEDEMALEAFGHFDRDGDGFVSADELLHAMCQIGVEMTRSHCVGIIEENDMDGDGRLNLEEFQKSCRSIHDHDGDRGEQSEGDDLSVTQLACRKRSEVFIAQLLKLAPAGVSCSVASCSTVPDLSVLTLATPTSSVHRGPSARRSVPQRRSLVNAMRNCWSSASRVF